ncbi:hypothetical protein ARMSODRAFT_981245 [Armillaria solidipes]|uniref:Uncharacterized protein n=1 Tax=Armillaria solidipes TaxID=1076256 RepID=A0A2H3B490_9AGAR|nr:hypothetical protein ARMSODRAFT_981245 [Armillaria solidipes]
MKRIVNEAYSIDLDKLSSTSVGIEALNTSENFPENLRELGYRYGGNGHLRDVDLTRYQGIHPLHMPTEAFPLSLIQVWLLIAPSPTTIALPFDDIETRLCLCTRQSRCPSCKIRLASRLYTRDTQYDFIALFAFESMANSTLADYHSLGMETRLGSATMMTIAMLPLLAGEMLTLVLIDSSLVASDQDVRCTHNKSGLWSWHLLRVRVMLRREATTELGEQTSVNKPTRDLIEMEPSLYTSLGPLTVLYKQIWYRV